MLKNITNSHKKRLFIVICFISIVSVLILLVSIKSNIRKFNQNLISNTFTLFADHLEKFNLDLNESEV